MSYLDDRAAAIRSLRAWTCTCGTNNPSDIGTCHTCQRPIWTCADCGTISPERCDTCTECGADNPEQGHELTREEWVSLQIGPRRVGGRYDHGHPDSEYEVLNVDRGPRATWPTWQITVRFTDGRVRTHCTGWDPKRDRIVAQALADVTIVSIGRLHDDEHGEHADILQRATITLDLRHHFRDPHIQADLRALTAHDPLVRDTVMNTPACGGSSPPPPTRSTATSPDPQPHRSPSSPNAPAAATAPRQLPWRCGPSSPETPSRQPHTDWTPTPACSPTATSQSTSSTATSTSLSSTVDPNRKDER